jgi:hypothetical protein
MAGARSYLRLPTRRSHAVVSRIPSQFLSLIGSVNSTTDIQKTAIKRRVVTSFKNCVTRRSKRDNMSNVQALRQVLDLPCQ